MTDRWFYVEYKAGDEWHLFDGPYPTLRKARVAITLFPGLKGTATRRIVKREVVG